MTICVSINNESTQLPVHCTLTSVQALLNLPTVGCVFAINDQIIPKGLWSKTRLNDGDEISLFQAIAGG